MIGVDTGVLIAVVLIVAGDRLLSFLKSRGVDLAQMSRRVDDLHEWHAKEDDQGVKVWYPRKGWEDAINRLSGSIERQSELAQQQSLILQQIHTQQQWILQQLQGSS